LCVSNRSIPRSQERPAVRIHNGETNLKSAVFRASPSNPQVFRSDRNRQHIKGLPILRDEFAAFPSAVREYKIQEFAFLHWRLTLERGGRAVRQFQ